MMQVLKCLLGVLGFLRDSLIDRGLKLLLDKIKSDDLLKLSML